MNHERDIKHGVMLKKLTLLSALFCASLSANSGGAPAGTAGAPGQGTCAACHGSGTPNAGSGSIRVEVLNGAAYTPGQPLTLRVTLNDPAARRWGFQLTARRASANTQTLGAFASIAGQGTTTPNASTIGHGSGGTRPGTAGPATWEVTWNPPADDQGDVTFYAAGNAANNNGQADGGDQVYTTSLQVPVASTGTVSGNYVLPQFVFGQGFITTLSFANANDAVANVTVNFFNDSGQPLQVGGSTNRVIQLNPKASASIRADDTGPTTTGWALIDLPDGVTSNAVFRQRVGGRIDQEAVVLLSRSNSTEARFIYDQSGSLNNALVLLNTSTNNATVTIRIRGEGGNILATLERAVNARSKAVIDFRTDPGLTAVAGQRGLAEFEVGGASIAVLALRFDDAGAITSIPNAE